MTGESSGWRCTGLQWGPDGPVLLWSAPGRGERTGPLAGRRGLSLVAVGERGCVGVWRGGRRTACLAGAVVPATRSGAQCADCRRLDRSMSVAADTRADDQQPYAVYLAWFGPGLLKVGITAAARGSARLLEQGAVAFTMLGRGPLMAARRTEELLGTVLGIRDRVPYAVKRAVRTALPPVPERFAELAGPYERASALDSWPDSLQRLPFEPVDHSDVFGLDRLAAAVAYSGAATTTELIGLADGAVVAGELLGAAGPDLHLRGESGVLIVDTRLLAGWVLRAGGPHLRTSAPVREAGGGGTTGTTVQDGLF